MALNMAIGFLFLGNGKYSFRRDNQAIAGLLISIYPHFPNHTNDNKYHLQALRHFYILAIEQRVFYAVDIKSYEVVHVWVEMEFQMGKDVFIKEKLQTPVLLQDSKKLVGVEVIDEDFYKVFVKYNNNNNKAIFVKRKLKKTNPKELENKGGNFPNNIKSNNNQRELELLLNLIKTFENTNEIMDYDIHTLDFILSGKSSQNLTKSQFIKKLGSEYKGLFKRKKIFDEKLTDTIVPLFIKEDRLEFFEAFFHLYRKYQDIGQVPSDFIMNFHVIFHFYGILSNMCFNKNQCEPSEIFNGSKLKKIRENLNNLFNFNHLMN